MDRRSGWTEADRRKAEARLAEARERGDAAEEIRALVDLAGIARALGDAWALVTVAQEAWTLAERESRWDQLARLALLFGDIAYSGLDYLQCYDHYANACAYAAMFARSSLVTADDAVSLPAVLARVDAVIDDMMTTGRTVIAQAFCEMLVAYEAFDGLGAPDPAFADHFRERLRLVTAERGRELAGAVTLN